jgi:hypothetical protein
MRKVLPAFAVALAVAFGATGGGGSASADNQGADWLVAGTGTLICCGQPMVHVNAQSDFLGANPRGHFWIRYPNGGPDFGGLIKCVNVSVSLAGLTGQIDTVKTGGAIGVPPQTIEAGKYIQIRVTDNGSPGTADTVNFDPPLPASDPPPSCPTNPETLLISQGNYVVHDQPVTDLADMLGLDQFIAQIESAANDPYG